MAARPRRPRAEADAGRERHCDPWRRRQGLGTTWRGLQALIKEKACLNSRARRSSLHSEARRIGRRGCGEAARTRAFPGPSLKHRPGRLLEPRCRGPSQFSGVVSSARAAWGASPGRVGQAGERPQMSRRAWGLQAEQTRRTAPDPRLRLLAFCLKLSAFFLLISLTRDLSFLSPSLCTRNPKLTPKTGEIKRNCFGFGGMGCVGGCF